MPTYPAAVYARPDPIPALRSTAPTNSTILGQYGDEIEAIEGTLGVNPQGASATVAARMTADEKKQTLTAGATQNFTTDVNGDLTLTFGVTFTAAPSVVMVGTQSATPVVFIPHTVTTTSATIRAFRLSDATAVVSTIVAATYQVSGVRT